MIQEISEIPKLTANIIMIKDENKNNDEERI